MRLTGSNGVKVPFKVKAEEEAEKEEKKSWAKRWKETRTAFGHIPTAFKLAWEADKAQTGWMALLTLWGALLPTAQAWTGKLIVDAVVHALNRRQPVEAGLEATLPILILEFGLITAGAVIAQVRTLVQQLLGSRLAHSIHLKVIRKAMSLDLRYFEDPAFYDKMQNARREVNYRPINMVNNSFLLVQNIITLLSAIVILLAFSPLVALVLFGTSVPAFVVQMRYSKLQFRLANWHAPEFRRKSYWEWLLTTDNAVKELKLFGLSEPLLKRYDEQFWNFYHEDTALARRRTFVSLLWGMVATASFYGAYAWVVWRTLQGAITLGDMTLYLTLFRQCQGYFRGVFDNVNQLYEGSLFMNNLVSFLKLEPDKVHLNGHQPQALPKPIRCGIEFRDVSFRYPDKEQWALRHLNLTIAPGEKLALVGANGAGKTTLVKLLTRLYEPTEGQILLDGVDLREYDIEELRRRIGVIFQDFVRYQTTARENIGFGQVTALEDEDRILEAARRGGADTVVTELKDGYDTMLGKWFDKGQELSGGQWQKIALGRAFMRDGELLVLDEPTSALDAEREYEIFQRFRDLTAGKMALLISHRFSTVRMADKIAVLENGGLLEYGSHSELLALGGTYARLFNLQAEGYR